MIDLIVDGLPDFISVREIVGALTNEVKIAGSKIGKVRINRKRRRAIVEIDEEVVQVVLEVMNGRQISGMDIRVSVKKYDADLAMNIRNYATQLKNLLYLERGEELAKFRLEIRYADGKSLEQLGNTLLEMWGRADSFPVNNYYQVRFISRHGETMLTENNFAVGDLVTVSKGNPLVNNTEGKVIQVEPTAVTLEFKGEPPYYVYGRGLRLDRYGNDQVFQHTLKTLKLLYAQDNSLPRRLEEILVGAEEPEWSLGNGGSVGADYLDEDQLIALNKALQAKDIFLIAGGAGTGKTSLAAEIIQQHVKKGLSVLAVATSLSSREVLSEKLVSLGSKVLKLDDVNLKQEAEYDKIYQRLLEIKNLKKKRDELTHPGGQWMQGLTYKDILDKAGFTKAGSANRYAGIPGYRLKEMAEWIKIQRKIDQLLNQLHQFQNQIWTRMLADYDLLCINAEEVAHLKQTFDLVLIDDAHMINEPETLPAYFKGKKVILVGDENQISPQVTSIEAKAGGLGDSLFVRLLTELDEEWIARLSTQHRLNFPLWNCLNSLWDVGQKIEHGFLAKDLTLNPWCCGLAATVLEAEANLVFIDTAAVGIGEDRIEEEYFNLLEADLVREFLQIGLDKNKKAQQATVLTFYPTQVKMIRKALKLSNTQFDYIHTIEQFCGQERDLVIISLVHNNSIGYLGKANSIPHLFTAISRARQKCILIGNRDTFSLHPIYHQLLEKIEHKGIIYTL